MTKSLMKSVKQPAIFTIILTLGLMSVTACSDKMIEDSGSPMVGELYIRFLSPAGTNILDSLNVCGDQEDYVKTKDSDIKLTCVNTWNNANMDREQHTTWLRIKEGVNNTYGLNEASPMEIGTVLHYHWHDMSLFFDDSRPETLEYTYVINLQSPLIFKNNDVHTIKWYVWMKGGIYDAYKCEVDGKEYPLASDAAVYNYWSEPWKEVFSPHGRVHDLAAQLTIHVDK